MKAHLFAVSLWGLTARASGHHDAAVLEARQALPSNAAVSVCYTYTSTYLTLVTPTSSALPTPTPPGFVPIILGIETLAVAKRDLEKRVGLGGFVSDNPANPNPSDCSAATIFELQIGGGVLLDLALPLFTEAGDPFAEFRSTGAPPADAISTTFNGVDGGVLSWANTAFFGGEAAFCQVPATGQVYSTFQGNLNVPPGCVTVQLRIYAASRCQNGNINPSSSSSGFPSSVPLTDVTQVVTASSSTFTETIPVTEVVATSSSSTFTETIPVTDVFTSPSSSFTPEVTPVSSLSSSSQIVITSTSTETTFVVTPSSSSATASATACPFTTSGSLLTNGGFESGPGNVVFTYAPLGALPGVLKKRNQGHKFNKKQLLTDTPDHDIAVVPSASAPRPYFDLCNYVLEISYNGGTEPTEDVFGVYLDFAQTLTTYTITFDALACGTDGYVIVDVNGITTTINNQDCSAGTAAAWGTYILTFDALGLGLDILYIRAVGDIGTSQDYFDNFIITAGGTAAGASSSSAAAVATPPVQRKVRL
ncbi:hypothetical protein N0V82_000013 [Gnomoniopsis sp. IMI 355080]|nr:hypothetical protein N0V82_000013 [Gnomoniopsis sp. IMI 355080]